VTLIITTLSIMTVLLYLKSVCYAKCCLCWVSFILSVTNNPVMLSVIMLKVVMLSVIMLKVVMLRVIMLNVVKLSVIILSVVAPMAHIA
jgi:hypothetical protein